MTTARNVAIVVALAAAVAYLPGAAGAGNTLAWILTLIFYGALAWFASTLYREHRSCIYGLGEETRVLLYVALGAGTLALVGTQRLWDTGAGTLVWVLVLGGAVVALFEVFRRARAY